MVATENELFKQMESKQIQLKAECQTHKKLEKELTERKEVETAYENKYKYLRGLIANTGDVNPNSLNNYKCFDTPSRQRAEIKKAKAELLKLRQKWSTLRPEPNVRSEFEEMEKRIATRRQEILELADDVITLWLKE